MPRKLTILVDLDSTVAALDQVWFSRYNERFGDDLSMDKIRSWDTHLYCKAGKAVYSVLNEPGLYRNLPLVPGAQAAVEEMCRAGHRIVIVSAAPKNSCDDKVAWVKENLPFVDPKDIFLAGNKELVFGDVLIDDGAHNLTAYRKQWGHYPLLCAISYPYNQEARSVVDIMAEDYRNPAMAWEQILDEVTYFADQDIRRDIPRKLDHGVGLVEA